MIRRIACAFVALAIVPATASAQDHADHSAHSQYASIRGREIKALDSAAIANYRSGAGMGFALSAELNSYPGPRHVLDLATQLELTPQQREAVTRIFETMQKSAIAKGEQIIEAERELDRRFAHRHLDAATLKQLTGRIAALNGELRAIHLGAHLEVTALLNEQQVRRYDELRGYTR